MATHCAICCEPRAATRSLEHFKCPSCMEKGSVEKMTCRACVRKCGDQCPWCRTTLDPKLPTVLSQTRVGAVMGRLVVVKRRTLRRCVHCCAPCGFSQNVSIASTSCTVSAIAFLAWYMPCRGTTCSWACFVQASLFAVYIGGLVPITMRPWNDSSMETIGLWHGLVGSVFLVFLMVQCNCEYSIFLLLLALCPCCAAFSMRLNDHWH